MAKLHELLAAEKTPTAAWNALVEDTIKKFSNASHFFDGHTKSLKMIEDNPANAKVEDAAREEKAVTTNVHDTLRYALDIFATAENLQYQKNATNQQAKGTVRFRGADFLVDMPVDELLGLEARLGKIREIFMKMPTLDATKHWVKDPQGSPGLWVTKFPEETTKGEKTVFPIVMSPATDKHPAQVQAATKDTVVGKFTTIKRSGAATAYQKSESIKLVDELMVEVKQARMRANETEAVTGRIAEPLVDLLLTYLNTKDW